MLQGYVGVFLYINMLSRNQYHGMYPPPTFDIDTTRLETPSKSGDLGVSMFDFRSVPSLKLTVRTCKWMVGR